MVKRIFALIILFLSVLFAPLWLSVILGFAAMIYFDLFWEACLLFLLSDFLYGSREVRYFNITFISFFVSVIVLVGLEFLKKKLKFYNK